MQKFIHSNYSIEDLEKFRDKKGFIDIDKIGIKLTKESREEVGNTERIKNWIDFNGTKALLKGEAKLEEENYEVYAELIVEEIAKKLEIPTAHYDLIKILNENGKETLGVLSPSFINLANEYLVTLHDLIGDEPEEQGDFMDTTSYNFTIKKLKETLLEDGYEQQEIERLIIEYKKRLLFSIIILDTDNHIENVAFIKKVVNGKNKIELAPNYDSEAALMLDYDKSTIKMLLSNFEGLKASVDQAHPRIGTLTPIEEGGWNSYWKDTLEVLCEEDEIYDYYCEIMNAQIDMDNILKEVEKRIQATVPEDVKLIAKYAYNIRAKTMEKLMNGELEQKEVKQATVNSLLKMLISRGLEQIRTSEQMQVGKILEQDIKNMQIGKKQLKKDIGGR